MVKSSDLIIIGEVTEQESELRLNLVFTNSWVEIKDLQSDKRSKDLNELSRIEVLQTGGTFGDITTPAIEGAPLLEKGKEYLLFLRDTPDGHFIIMGGVSGAYGINNGILTYQGKSNPLRHHFQGKSIESMLKEIEKELK